jgi:hypothetical protein
MGLFDGYFDPQQWPDSGGLLSRLLALQQQQGQRQQSPDFDQAPFIPRAPMPTPLVQALAVQQPGIPGNASRANNDQSVISDAFADPVRPGSQYAQGAFGLCAAGPAGCAMGAGLTAGQAILGGAALGGLGAMILNNGRKDPTKVLPLPEGLIGNNARPGGGRSNTDMPGVDPTAEELFDRLTGGHSDILPDGTRRGPNGIRLRPDRGQGPRIDIPANGEKEPETIHFPGSNQ